ncbi:carbohydrate sulfotransferase 11-like isoform X2 [Anneissia japonica]|nr:carbohydrate sulfotransferase 11-like isoform X2 [Anneissia japonica]
MNFEKNAKFSNKFLKTGKKMPLEVEKPESIDEFMQRYSAIHKRTNKYVSEMCRMYRNKIPGGKPPLLVNEKHKIAYCQTAKIGSDVWARALLILAGNNNYTEVMKMNGKQVIQAKKKHVKQLSQFPDLQQKQIMDTYTKFMFVRHPLSRLLSAFNDKLSPENETDIHDQQFKMIYRAIGADFKWDNKEKGNKVQFKDFLNMVVNSIYSQNPHWKAIHTSCFPCNVHYDIIGRFEDFENEAKYIFKLANVTDFKFPRSKKKHITNSSKLDTIRSAYSSVPVPLLLDIYNKYKYDFTLFNYEIPLAMPFKE